MPGPSFSPLNDPSYYNPPKPKGEVTLDVDPFSFVKGTAPGLKSTQPVNRNQSSEQAPVCSSSSSGLIDTPAIPAPSGSFLGQDPFATSTAAPSAGMHSDLFFESNPVVNPHSDPFKPAHEPKQVFADDPFLSGSTASSHDPFAVRATLPHSDPFVSPAMMLLLSNLANPQTQCPQVSEAIPSDSRPPPILSSRPPVPPPWLARTSSAKPRRLRSPRHRVPASVALQTTWE